MAGLLFNGTGYVSFPKDNRLILSQSDGWTWLIKMKYGTNAGTKKEAVFVGQQDGSLINYVETFVGQDTQSDTWNRNRFVCHLRTAGGTAETIESPSLTFPDADYAIYFVRKQGNTLAVGRCSAGGSVVKTTKTNSQLFDIPLQEFFLGYAGNRTTSAHVPLGSGREVREFGLVSRSMSDADIQSYANGTSFATIAGANLFGFAPMDEGAGTTVDFDVDVTPVVGAISGGLTWIADGAATITIESAATTLSGSDITLTYSGSSATINIESASITLTGSDIDFIVAGGSATVTLPPMYRNTNSLVGVVSFSFVNVVRSSDGFEIDSATGLSTNASSVLSFQPTGAVAGTEYIVLWKETTGQFGSAKVTAS